MGQEPRMKILDDFAQTGMFEDLIGTRKEQKQSDKHVYKID